MVGSLALGSDGHFLGLWAVCGLPILCHELSGS